MRRRLCSLFFIFWAFHTAFDSLSAQALLPNPLPCNSGLPIRDFSCPENLPVGDPDEFDILVDNAPGSAMGVDVYLKEVRLLVRHTWVGDLDIRLVAPNGRTIILMEDEGGGDDDIGNYDPFNCNGYATFGINSCLSIEDDLPPYTNGPYLPEESFFHFHDGTNPNGIWTLQVCDDVVEDGGTLEYFELVFEPIECLPLQEARIARVDTTTVILDWLPGTNCGPVLIEYGTPGFIPGNRFAPGEGAVVEVNACAPFFLERLQPDTEYEIYLRNYCQQTGQFSTNSCPLRVRTGCLPLPPSLVTDFDDQELCGTSCGNVCEVSGSWRNDQELDDFDWLVANGATPTSGTGPTSDVNGDGNYIYIEASGSFPCEEGGEAYLVSNCIQLNKAGTDTCHLSFNYHMFGFQTGQLRLEISEDGGFSWNTFWQRSGSQGNGWKKVYLSLSDYENGANLQFRFVAVKGNGSKGDIALDEIVFYGSEDLGSPDQAFFVDADGDGYGDPTRSIFSCAALVPDGYVNNGLDCDDTDPSLNPGAEEIPCDGIDNNCNGMMDDGELPPPGVQNDTICSGEQAMVCAVPSDPENFILWYGSPDGDDIVGPIGACFFPELPLNNSSSPVIYRFYVEELGLDCRSAMRSEVTVVVHPNPRLSLDVAPTVCQGQSLDLGTVPVEDANFTGGQLYFSDTFPFTPDQALDTNVVDPGRIYFQMISSQGCVDQDSFDVLTTAGPSLSFFPAQTIGLCNEATQVVKVRIDQGKGPYEFLWENGAQADSLIVEAPPEGAQVEKIGIRVTDVDGCISSDTLEVTGSDGLLGVQRSVRSISECGGNDGRIAFTPLSGAPPFRYQWSGTTGIQGDSIVNENTFVLDSLRQGAYDITVTDGVTGDCDFVIRSVLVNGPDAVLNPPVVKEVSCAGAADGEICIEVDIGVNPRFLWSTGDTTNCIDGLSGGFYSVTVTEGECRNIIENIEIEEADPVRLVFDEASPTCSDKNDGSIALSVFGGKSPIRYQWSSGQNTRVLENIGTGQYKVTVTDDNGCISTDSLLLRAPDPLRIFLDSLRNISCFGETDGGIRISSVGGRGPYKYAWSNGVQAPVVQGLERGVYTISVTDFNECVVSEDFTIREPEVLNISLAELVQPLCVGDNTGKIAVQVDGGTYPYFYEWSNGEQDSVLEEMEVGEYRLWVRDASNCFSDTFSVSLTATSELDLVVVIDQPDCVGKQNGSIAVNPNGTAPFFYDWGNGEVGNALTAVGVGSYPLEITDGDGCIYDTTIVVEAPQAIETEIDLRPPACSGGSDGLILLNVDGNLTAPVRYLWSDGSTERNRSDLSDGQYRLTITDGNQCRLVTDTLTLQSPEPLISRVLEVGPIKCKGEATGFIELETSGGASPYRFTWDGLDQNTESVFDIPAGTYRVVVRDANNCTFETTIPIQEPQVLDVAIDLNVGDICSGDTTNLLRAQVAGGTPPYQYSWNNGKDTREIANVSPGDYVVAVTDANNCEEQAPTIKVKDASIQLQMDSFYVKDISCNGATDGQATAQISGGRAPYTFHFSNNYRIITNEQEATAMDLPAARNYRVTITDGNGCVIVSENKTVRQPPVLSIALGEIRSVTCFEGSDGRILVNVNGGNTPYHYSWLDGAGDTISREAILDSVPVGMYSLILEDNNGCRRSLSDIQVGGGGTSVRLVDSLVQVFDVRCTGAEEGSIFITLTGGKPPYRYQWSNGSGNEDQSQLLPGPYSLTVTDKDNCSFIFDEFVIEEPAAPVLEPILSVTDVQCHGAADGEAVARPEGGMPPYNISWLKDGESILQNADTLSTMGPGTYRMVIIDQNECRKEVDFNIDQPDSLQVQINIIPPAEPGTAHILRAIAAGGTPDYTFTWSTGEQGVEITGDGSGGFGVTVVDANNCISRDSVFLTTTFESVNIREVKIFPNPASTSAQVNVTLENSLPLHLRLLDMSGREILHHASSKQQRHQFLIDLSALRSGEYIVRLSNGKAVVYTGKLLIVK